MREFPVSLLSGDVRNRGYPVGNVISNQTFSTNPKNGYGGIRLQVHFPEIVRLQYSLSIFTLSQRKI